jgi:hypothetical protein
MDFVYVIVLIIFLFFGIGAIQKGIASLKKAWQAAVKIGSLDGFYQAYASGFKRRGMWMILATLLLFPSAGLALSAVIAVQRIRHGKLRFITYLVVLLGTLVILAGGYGVITWLKTSMLWLIAAGGLSLLWIILALAFAPLKPKTVKKD